MLNSAANIFVQTFRVGFNLLTIPSAYGPASIFYRFRVIASYSSKVADFNYTPPAFAASGDLYRQKTRVRGLSWGVACVILCLAVLIQYWRVTDGQTNSRIHDDS